MCMCVSLKCWARTILQIRIEEEYSTVRLRNTTRCERKLDTPQCEREIQLQQWRGFCASEKQDRVKLGMACDLWDKMNRLERVHCASERPGRSNIDVNNLNTVRARYTTRCEQENAQCE